MKDSKEITLFIDTYNSNHSDAVLMVADYLSNNQNSSAEIIVSEKNQLNLKIMNNNVEGHLDLDFDLNSNTNDELKTFFYWPHLPSKGKIRV